MTSRDLKVGDHVRHVWSGWSGPIIAITFLGHIEVRPTHPRPKEVLDGERGFIPTPDDWPGWAPITVEPEELELVEAGE